MSTEDSIIIELDNEKTERYTSNNNLNLKIIDESVKRSEGISDCQIKIYEESKVRANDISLVYKLIYNQINNSASENNKIYFNIYDLENKVTKINNELEYIKNNIKPNNLNRFDIINEQLENIKNNVSNNKINDISNFDLINNRIESVKNNISIDKKNELDEFEKIKSNINILQENLDKYFKLVDQIKNIKINTSDENQFEELENIKDNIFKLQKNLNEYNLNNQEDFIKIYNQIEDIKINIYNDRKIELDEIEDIKNNINKLHENFDKNKIENIDEFIEIDNQIKNIKADIINEKKKDLEKIEKIKNHVKNLQENLNENKNENINEFFDLDNKIEKIKDDVISLHENFNKNEINNIDEFDNLNNRIEEMYNKMIEDNLDLNNDIKNINNNFENIDKLKIKKGFYSNFTSELINNNTFNDLKFLYNYNNETLTNLSKKIISCSNSKLFNESKENLFQFLKINLNLIDRILICLPNGNVVFDSKKQNNSYYNFIYNNINENHNTRQAILTAQLSNDGIGGEIKYSTTTGNYEIYYAVRIGKLGLSDGTIVLSKKSIENINNKIDNKIIEDKGYYSNIIDYVSKNKNYINIYNFYQDSKFENINYANNIIKSKTEEEYIKAKDVLDNFLLKNKKIFNRLLLTLPDGTVIYDSNKINSFSKFKNKTINNNQNTRQSILNAQLSNDGIGGEINYSILKSKYDINFSSRLGNLGNNIGTISFFKELETLEQFIEKQNNEQIEKGFESNLIITNNYFNNLFNINENTKSTLFTLSKILIESTNSTQYNDAKNNIKLLLDLNKDIFDSITIILPNGNVVYNSKSNKNYYKNYKNNSIDENYMNRQSIITSQLSNNGVGVEIKFSYSVKVKNTFYSLRIGELGFNIGTILLSKKENI